VPTVQSPLKSGWSSNRPIREFKPTSPPKHLFSSAATSTRNALQQGSRSTDSILLDSPSNKLSTQREMLQTSPRSPRSKLREVYVKLDDSRAALLPAPDAGAQGILNYATPPRYDDAPAPGDPLRTSRRGPEELFGYVAFDRYRTTNAVMSEWSRGNGLDLSRTYPGQPLGRFPGHGGKVHGHWDRCWFAAN